MIRQMRRHVDGQNDWVQSFCTVIAVVLALFILCKGISFYLRHECNKTEACYFYNQETHEKQIAYFCVTKSGIEKKIYPEQKREFQRILQKGGYESRQVGTPPPPPGLQEFLRTKKEK